MRSLKSRFMARSIHSLLSFCFATMAMFSAPIAFAYDVTSFNPSVVFSGTSPEDVTALDDAVGITGYTIEDFEDSTLISELTVEFCDFEASNTILENRILDIYSDGMWDGDYVFADWCHAPPPVDTTFRFLDGARSIGIGVGDIETAVELKINGFSFGLVGDLPNYNREIDNAREVYIRIDAEPGDALINEVKFVQPQGDQINFDRLAIDSSAVDYDGDGFFACEYDFCTDCDDTDPVVNPDAYEVPGDFVDDNCDGDLGGCDPCLDWKNHGHYVRCVAHTVEDLVSDGVLTEEQGDDLISSAARTDIGKKGYVPGECQ